MSRNRLYLLCPAVLAIIAAALFASPGCGSDTCQGARSKLCEKACACTSKCTLNGINFDSQSGCSFAFGAQCDPTKHDVDWAACSKALDTAKCSGGDIPDGGTTGDGGVESVLLIPEECSGAMGAGGSGGGSTSTSSATSSGSM